MSTPKKLALAAFSFAATFLVPILAFAQDDKVGANINDVKAWAAAGAGIAIGLGVLGGALGQGRAAAAALEGISRNPGASARIQTPMILGLALIESLVLLAFVIAFFLQGYAIEPAPSPRRPVGGARAAARRAQVARDVAEPDECRDDEQRGRRAARACCVVDEHDAADRRAPPRRAPRRGGARAGRPRRGAPGPRCWSVRRPRRRSSRISRSCMGMS